MEEKVNWTIVRSIIVAWWLNLILCVLISILIMSGFYLYYKEVNEAKEDNISNQKATCMNNGGCWINNRCQNPCVGKW